MVAWADRVTSRDNTNPDELAEALRCYQQAAEAGHAGACLKLGALYKRGQWVAYDIARSLALFQRAVELGQGAVLQRALSNLGYNYSYGQGTAVDHERAFHLWAHSALRFDDPNALYKLGDMYRHGDFVTVDNAMAFSLYVKADSFDEDEGFESDIARRLGDCYLHGIGCERDLLEAYRQLQRSERAHILRLSEDPEWVSLTMPKLKALLRECRAAIDNELGADLTT